MFMVDFVRPAHPLGIPIIGFSKHFESLMDENVMHYKISSAVCHYP
jgi:hypothetical protein